MTGEIRIAIYGAAVVICSTTIASAEDVRGHYLEARTCQVYTGPCFANGEVGQTGKDAVMAWSIRSGVVQGIDLSGLNVVVLVRATDTLGFQGIEGSVSARSVILVDANAQGDQREALIRFARDQAGKAGLDVARVKSMPIDMELNTAELTGQLVAGDDVLLTTRQARKGDCICSNEAAYYPPLADVEFFAPGVTIEGNITARALGSRWSIPQTRSAYMATFRVQ